MNLYEIRQHQNNDYDTYDSAVVAAETSGEARLIHPGGKSDWDGKAGAFSSWAGVEAVSAVLIGEAVEGIEKGVIVASFNAG